MFHVKLQSAEDRLEESIRAARERLYEARGREAKLRRWREVCRLLDRRSPHYVRFLARLRAMP